MILNMKYILNQVLLVVNDVCCDLYMTDFPQKHFFIFFWGCRQKYLLCIETVLSGISEAHTHLNVKMV